MAGLKRSLKCDDLLTMTISHSMDCNVQKETLLIAQFVQLRTGPQHHHQQQGSSGSSGSTTSKRQRFNNNNNKTGCPATGKKNPATAALERLEASWDYHSFPTAIAIIN